MKLQGRAKLLLIFVDETDTWGDAREPLYEAIVEKLCDLGIGGVTVNSGIMGFGANHRLHKKRLFGIPDDRPVTILVVESEERLRAAIPAIRPMVVDGMFFLVDGEVIV
jgi:PII-like signaling protein